MHFGPDNDRTTAEGNPHLLENGGYLQFMYKCTRTLLTVYIYYSRELNPTLIYKYTHQLDFNSSSSPSYNNLQDRQDRSSKDRKSIVTRDSRAQYYRHNKLNPAVGGGDKSKSHMDARNCTLARPQFQVKSQCTWMQHCS